MDTSILKQSASFEDELVSGEVVVGSRATSELAPGSILQGKYQLRGVLGHGGFAVVYDAEHLGLSRPVAIKVLHVADDTPLALLERFRREARISALVHHPNVLEVYDTGALPDGSPYLVMERVNGETLFDCIRRGPCSVAMTVEVGRQLMLGLSAIAEAGIVHRDIKPANIMLHDAGDGAPQIKLVDFGISRHMAIEPQARLTCHGALVGTPQYMAPEQIRGEEVDVRSDLYAAGAVLYETLTGHAPHESENFSELVVAILNNPMRPISELRPDCPTELSRILTTALSRSRAKRYASPRELLAALDELARVYDLPRGAAAFRTTTCEDPILLTSLRTSSPGGCGFSLSLRELRRPLPLAVAALLLAAPFALREYRGEPEANKGALQVLASASEGEAAMGAVHALAEQVANATAPVPSAALAPRPALADEPVLEVVAVPDRVTALPVPVRANAPAAPRAIQALVKPATPASASAPEPQAAATEPAVLHPSAAQQVTVTDVASPEQHQRWEETMQHALASLVRGRLDDAKREYEEAARLAPKEPASFRGLGLVAARLGDEREARRALQHYLTLSPNAGDAEAITSRLATLRSH